MLLLLQPKLWSLISSFFPREEEMSSVTTISTKPFSTPLPVSVQSLLPRTIGPTSSPYAFFNPASIPSCQVWFDAADTGTITGTSQVTQWRSKGIQNCVATNGAGSCSSGNLTSNGLNFIRCPAQFSLQFTASLVSQAQSWFLVVRNLTPLTESPQNFWGPINVTASSQAAIYFNFDAGVIVGGLSASGVAFTLVASGLTNPLNQINSYAFVNSATSTALNIVTENGASQTLSTSDLASGYNTNLISYNINTPAVFYDTATDVFEIIYFGRDITTQERQQVEGYLSWKWGISSKLPNNHPFKAIPPGLNVPPSIYQRAFFNRPFSPLSIPNAVLWLDAADPSTVVVSAGSVIQWNDKSGLGNNTTEVSTTAPTYSSNGVIFSSPNTTYLRGALDFTYSNVATTFVVMMPNSNSSAIYLPRMFSLANTSVSTDVYFAPQTNFILNNNSTNQQIITYFNTNTDPTGLGINIQTAVPTTSGTRVLYTNNSTYNGTSFRIDAFLNGSGTTNSSRSGTFSSNVNFVQTYNRYVLGGNPFNPTSSGDTFDGTIYEVIAFSSSLAAAQRQQVEGYLAWKWGLQTSLPLTHPYKFFSPPPSINRSFSPLDLPNLVLWLDAADTATVTVSAGNVTQWNDKSGNGNTMTGNSGPKSGTATANGLNILDVTAGGYFTRTSFTFPAQYSIFTVAFTSATGVNTLVSTTPDITFLMRRSAIQFGNGGGGWNSFTTSFTSASNILVEVLNTGSDGTFYTNGNFLETISGVTATGSELGIGNRLNNLSEPWNGYLCEILIFNIALPTTKRQQVEGYLAWKWGLQASLPANHPYKLSPPPPS